MSSFDLSVIARKCIILWDTESSHLAINPLTIVFLNELSLI